jgi:hypothetical protein
MDGGPVSGLVERPIHREGKDVEGDIAAMSSPLEEVDPCHYRRGPRPKLIVAGVTERLIDLLIAGLVRSP